MMPCHLSQGAWVARKSGLNAVLMVALFFGLPATGRGMVQLRPDLPGQVQEPAGGLEEKSASAEPARDRSLGRGLWDGVGCYGDAWASGDFLVRIRRTFDSVGGKSGLDLEGVVVQSEDHYRVVFDYRQSTFAVFRHSIKKELDLSRQKDGLAPERVEEVRYGATLNAQGVLRRRRFPERASALEKFHWDSFGLPVLSLMEFPDFRWLAMTGGYSPNEEARFRSAAKRSEDVVVAVRERSGGMVDFDTRWKANRQGTSVFHGTCTFDATKLVPVRRTGEVRTTTKEGLRRISPQATSDFDWEEHDGVWLLRSMILQEDRGQMFVNNEEHVGSQVVEFHFHWFSFNQPIDPTMFDGSHLRSEDAFQKLVDPVRAGAESLLEERGNKSGD